MLALAFRNAPIMPISASPFVAGAGLRVPAFAADGYSVRRGAGVVRLALGSGRGAAWRQSQHARSFVAAAKDAGHRPGGALAGAAGLRRTAGHQPAQSGTSGLRLRHRESRHSSKSIRRCPATPPSASTRSIARSRTVCCNYPMCKASSLALYSPLSFDNWGEFVAVEGKGDPKPERRERLFVGPGQPAVLFHHRAERRARTRFQSDRQPWFAAGRHRQRGLRQALFRQRRPAGQALRHEQRELCRRLRNRRRGA